jgi:hypothetical protein
MTDDFFSIPKDAKILPVIDEKTGEVPKVKPFFTLDNIPKQILCEDNCPMCQYLKERYTRKMRQWEILEVRDDFDDPRFLIHNNSYEDLKALEEL